MTSFSLQDPDLFRRQAYVGGHWCEADNDATLKVNNPATGEGTRVRIRKADLLKVGGSYPMVSKSSLDSVATGSVKADNWLLIRNHPEGRTSVALSMKIDTRFPTKHLCPSCPAGRFSSEPSGKRHAHSPATGITRGTKTGDHLSR
jgi:hypothetical protein